MVLYRNMYIVIISCLRTWPEFVLELSFRLESRLNFPPLQPFSRAVIYLFHVASVYSTECNATMHIEPRSFNRKTQREQTVHWCQSNIGILLRIIVVRWIQDELCKCISLICTSRPLTPVIIILPELQRPTFLYSSNPILPFIFFYSKRNNNM